MSENQIDLFEIIPQRLSIHAMRSSGYRDAAHAVAELIDNAVEAGKPLNEPTNIEVICVDAETLVNQRARMRMKNVCVYDDGRGMDTRTLRMALQFGNGTHLLEGSQTGIGKFGMGLPNSSISQCQRVDVYTWQNGRCIQSYLDIQQIRDGTQKSVPEPTETEIPNELRELISSELKSHGTLVVWSQLDRMKWKGSNAFLRNAEFLVGRMYRYFIADGSVRIRLAAYESTRFVTELKHEAYVRPNDPLGLMSETLAPGDWANSPPFVQLGEDQIVPVAYGGTTHEVQLRFSICRPEVRLEGGNSAIGRWAKKNQGVSVVRAQRELEMNRMFEDIADARERWWGVEVAFGAELDDVFGVANTKQAATDFLNIDLDEDAEVEDLRPHEYREQLVESEDPKLAIYEIGQIIRKSLKTIRKQIEQMRSGERSGTTEDGPNTAEQIATRITRERQISRQESGASDVDEALPPEERSRMLVEGLVQHGRDEGSATAIASDWVKNDLKYAFVPQNVSSPAFFEVVRQAGMLQIMLNQRHPAYEHLFALSNDAASQDGGASSNEVMGLKLLLCAWARMEDRAGEDRTEELEHIRFEWGSIAKDFLAGIE